MRTAGGIALLLATATLVSCAPAADEDPLGLWGEPPQGPYVEISPAGAWLGYDGCNSIAGSWERSSGEIVVTIGSATEKACADVDAWLSRMATATIADRELTIRDADGATLGTLTRQDDRSVRTPG